MMLAILLALTCSTQLWSKKILTDPGAVAALAAELGKDPSQVSSLIHNARSKNLLTRGVKGRAGGEMTPLAKELLNGTR